MLIFPISELLSMALAVDPVGGALLTKLFDDHNDRLLSIANDVLENHADAEDAVSITFFKVWKHIDEFENKKEDDIKKLLTTYVINSAKDVKKHRNTKKNRTVSLVKDDGEGNYEEIDIPDSINIEELMLRNESIQEIVRCMNKLPDEDRQILVLKYEFGYSSKKIAEVMNMNANTVDSRIFRAKKKLYEMLKEYYNG